MKILMIHTSYNELPLLRYKAEHCRQNHLDLFIIDNMSTDGSKEFLKENNIPHSFIDTNNSFDLRPLLQAMHEKIHQLRPDWFIYAGVDMFPEAQPSLTSMILKADQDGFTQLRFRQMIISYTGEVRSPEQNPFNNYFYYREAPKQVLISKYDPSIRIVPDGIFRAKKIIKDDAGIFFEMHASKTTEERLETFQRRKKAWAGGMNKGWGIHYPAEAAVNFTYDKNKCLNIREHHEFSMYTRLQNLEIKNDIQLSHR